MEMGVMMNYSLRFIFVGIIFSSSMVCTEDKPFQCKVPVERVKNADKRDQKQKDYTELLVDVAKDVAAAYLIMMSANFIHECGHALVGSALYRIPSHIHIGQPDGSKPWLQGRVLTINSFNPFKGGSTISWYRAGTPAWQHVFKGLAGPTAGSLYCLWKYFALRKKSSNEYKHLISKAICFSMFFVNLAQLVPDRNNDGMQIYRALKGIPLT